MIVVLVLTAGTITLPGARTEASVYLYITPVLPTNPAFAADARRLAAGCLQQRVGPLQVCKASAQGSCEGHVEKAFRLCLAGIQGVEFWLGVCARQDGCARVYPLFPIPAEQAFDSNVNPTFSTSGIGQYAATGLSADLHKGPGACVFNGRSVHPPNEADLCAKLYLLLAKPMDPQTFAALRPYFDRGFSINTRGEDEETMLHRAIRGNSLAMVQLLVARGADPNARGAKGVTPLEYAAYGGAIQVADFLLTHGAKVTLGDDDGATVLHYAVRSGSLEILQYFVGHGADANAKSSSGTPLHLSVDTKNVPMVDFLVAHGAQPDLVDQQDRTALDKALAIPEPTGIHMAALLVARGADVNRKDRQGLSPLMRAVTQRQDMIVAFLVDHRADANAMDSSGRTVLLQALSSRDAPSANAIDLLLAHGSDPNARDTSGWTALHLGAAFGYGTIVKSLVSHGANLNLPDSHGKTPLCLALDKHQDSVAAYLHSVGARCP
jgi:ankyrin repeat protein